MINRLNKEAHLVEELNGVRCSIVEKNISKERADFLKNLLEFNGYNVIVAPAPPPKAPPPKPPAPVAGTAPANPAPAAGQAPAASPAPVTPPANAPAAAPPADPAPQIPPAPPAPELFIVGVTQISFHPMLAVYERALYRPDGKLVSIAYWNQELEQEEWYWKNK